MEISHSATRAVVRSGTDPVHPKGVQGLRSGHLSSTTTYHVFVDLALLCVPSCLNMFELSLLLTSWHHHLGHLRVLRLFLLGN